MLGTLSKQQKEKVASFIQFVGANEKVAIKKLKACNWNLEQAVEEHLLEESPPVKADMAKLTEMFTKYKDKSEDAILIEGMEMFCNDLGVDPMDPVILVIAHALNADRACVFTRQQFIEGLAKLGYDSIAKLKAALPSLRGQLNDPEKFRDIYNFSFNYNKEPQQKSLPLEVAIPLWKLLLQDKYQNLDDWCEFVQTKHGKAISRDTWSLFYDFVTTVKPDASNYDGDGAWPILIDEYVLHLKSK